MDKNQKKQEVFELVAVFGEKLSQIATELDKIPDEECAEEYGGMIKRYTFHSKEAYDAYRLACDDCFGWQGYGFVDADAEIIGIEKAEKFFNGEDD